MSTKHHSSRGNASGDPPTLLHRPRGSLWLWLNWLGHEVTMLVEVVTNPTLSHFAEDRDKHPQPVRFDICTQT